MELFEETYLPLLQRAVIERLAVFALRDELERDDSAGPYRKSVLYLVSNALEETARIPLFREDGEPILGLAKFVVDHDETANLERLGKIDVVLGPTDSHAPASDSSTATTYVGFSSDSATRAATIARILNSGGDS